ncbi:MAG: hypothetical protein QNK30_10255 [Bacteroidales bacterium]|nr:hypothetical protein [Bacteroidales bacterium]
MKNSKTQLSWMLFVPILLFLSIHSTAQDKDSSSIKRDDAVKIFIDCRHCDMDYIRREIPYVNYVRDTREAQVYILETSQETGSGGNEYTFFFQGQFDFKEMNDTLTYASLPDDTRDNIRYGRTKIIKAGLMRYVAKSSMINEIEISFDGDAEEEVVVDRWNNWVFELDINPEYEGEESYKSFDLENSINIRKITPDWKFEFDVEYDMRRNKYISDDTTIIAIRESIRSENLIVKSINSHWSAGLSFGLGNSTYRNNKFFFDIYPSVEYNIFPYEESNFKQFRIQYGLGLNNFTYNDSTIYNKIQETRMAQRLLLAFQIQQKWGSVNISMGASNYFYDFSKYRLELEGYIRIRIVKGLSLSLYGGIAKIHDQLSLVKGDLSGTDILLRLRELATEYSVDFGVGLSYTFGSIYNNVVNPRFGN